MSDAIFWILIFILSLAVLIKASDFFTQAAEQIGLNLGIPQYVIGVTIVSVGTSLPELISSVLAVIEGVPEVVAGNVVGSNIANIFLILACGAIFSKQRLRVEKSLLPVDLPLLIGSALFLGITVYDDHEFTFGEAVLFLIANFVFIAYNVFENRQRGNRKVDELNRRRTFNGEIGKQLLILVLSGVFIYFGAKYTIDSIIKISDILQIATGVIAVTAVALGTSLPELAVTYSAARKGNGGIVIGNVLGSNIFNTFMVMGIPGLMATLPFPDSLINPGLIIMIVATALFLVVTVDREISRWEGMFFVLIYIYFIGKSFGLM